MSGIYIHIPFCVKKCSYCDFYSVPYTRTLAETYVTYLMKEIGIFCSHAHRKTFIDMETLYIGGGTPSLLEADQFHEIIKALSNYVDLSGLKEFTIEVNPGTLSTEKLQTYRTAGVNRISIGAQSFNDSFLKRLGRTHCSRDIDSTMDSARKAGITNINIDLIFGIPLQTEGDVMEDTRKALNLSPTHFSVYALSLEEGTPLFEEVKGGLETPSEEEYASYYWITKSFLEERGFHHYETSNFAEKDSECVHNMGYWLSDEYIAFGASASGHLKRGYPPGGFRYTNHANMGDYFKTIDKRQLPRAEVQENDVQTAWMERLIMGLRLTGGISLKDIQEELGDPPRSLQKKIHHLLSSDLLKKDGDHLKIPRQFIFTSNEILQHLV